MHGDTRARESDTMTSQYGPYPDTVLQTLDLAWDSGLDSTDWTQWLGNLDVAQTLRLRIDSDSGGKDSGLDLDSGMLMILNLILQLTLTLELGTLD